MNLTRKIKYFFQKLQELDTDKTSKKYKKEEAKIKEVSKELIRVMNDNDTLERNHAS